MFEKKSDKSNWLRLPIQYFASGGEGGEGGADGGKGGTGDEPPTTLTAEQVEKMIQSATDKVRTEWSQKNKELQKKLDEEKQSKMTEQEKLDLAKQELDEQKAELAKEKNKVFAVNALASKEVGLPASFLQFVTSDSDDNTTEKIKILKTEFDKAVAAAVDETFKETSRKHNKGFGDITTGTTDFAALAAKNNIRNQ